MITAKNWQSLIDVDFPKRKPITERTRATTMANSKRFRGSVRVVMGKFSTDAEIDARREMVLRKPLP